VPSVTQSLTNNHTLDPHPSITDWLDTLPAATDWICWAVVKIENWRHQKKFEEYPEQ